MCKKWASLKVMWCDCQGTINQPLFLTPSTASAAYLSPAEAKKCLFEQVGKYMQQSSQQLLFLNLHFSHFALLCQLHCIFFSSAVHLPVCCAWKGKYRMQIAESLEGKCAENGIGVEKWAEKPFLLRNGHWRWSLCTVNENELSAAKMCKMQFWLFQ